MVFVVITTGLQLVIYILNSALAFWYIALCAQYISDNLITVIPGYITTDLIAAVLEYTAGVLLLQSSLHSLAFCHKHSAWRSVVNPGVIFMGMILVQHEHMTSQPKTNYPRHEHGCRRAELGIPGP